MRVARAAKPSCASTVTKCFTLLMNDCPPCRLCPPVTVHVLILELHVENTSSVDAWHSMQLGTLIIRLAS